MIWTAVVSLGAVTKCKCPSSCVILVLQEEKSFWGAFFPSLFLFQFHPSVINRHFVAWNYDIFSSLLFKSRRRWYIITIATSSAVSFNVMIVRLLKILVHYILFITFDILLFKKCLWTNILAAYIQSPFRYSFGPSCYSCRKWSHWWCLQSAPLTKPSPDSPPPPLLPPVPPPIPPHLHHRPSPEPGKKKNIPSDAWTGRDWAKGQISHTIQYSMSYTWLLVLHTSRSSASGFFCRIYDQKYIHLIVYCLKKLIIHYLMSHFIHIFCIRLQEED